MMKAYTLSGAMGGESILVVKGQAAILIDSGFDFCADQDVYKRQVLRRLPTRYL